MSALIQRSLFLFALALLSVTQLSANPPVVLPNSVPVFQQAKLTASDSSLFDFFGNAVALEGDTAVVGVPSDGSGSVYVYRFNGVSWLLEQKIIPFDAGGNEFGDAVAISGNTLMVGSRGSSSDAGSVYVYTHSGRVWTPRQKLVPNDAQAGAAFGAALALDGDTALIGAYHSDAQGPDSGSAYIFVRTANVWNQQARLLPPSPATNTYFGYAVALDSNTALIGAYGTQFNGRFNGSAYVFARSGSAWSLQAQLTANDVARADYFGSAVALDDGVALIGAQHKRGAAGLEAGSAYIFVQDGTAWSQQAKLIPNDAAAHDFFGIAVSLDGNRALVGAYSDDDRGNSSGSAYTFTQVDGVWQQGDKLTASDGAVYDYFGFALALDGNRALIGAYGDDDFGSASGSAYLFAYGEQAGDCDENGLISTNDLTVLREAIFATDAPATCDANGDSAIDAGDLACVANILNSGDSCTP